MTTQGLYKDGFYKVAQEGATFVLVTLFNPETCEERHEVARDYDFFDRSRDNDELYYLEINKDIERIWRHRNGEILINDTVFVIKGRKVPVGTVAKVIDKKPYKDRYGRLQAIYLYLDNGQKTNIDNCILVINARG